MSEEETEKDNNQRNAENSNKQESNNFRLLGNQAMADRDYVKAIEFYSKALLVDENNHILYSNRSAAYIALKQSEEALQDAEKCVDIDPKWPKGYLRLGHALMELNMFEKASKALKEGLEVNEVLQNKKHQISLKALLKHVGMKEIEFANDKLFEKLKGRWHGRLSDDVGGYWQEFNFKSTSSVIVTIMDRIVESKLKLNATKTPVEMDISIDLQPEEYQVDENNNQIKQELVKYIIDVQDDELLICSNDEDTEIRPTEFNGRTFLKMKRGARESISLDVIEKVKKMSQNEKINSYIKEALEIFPTSNDPNSPNIRLMPNESDSLEEKKRIGLENIKFQARNYEITRIYGFKVENDVRDLLLDNKQAIDENQTVLVQRLKVKMQECNLLPGDSELSDFKERQKDYNDYQAKTELQKIIEKQVAEKIKTEKEIAKKYETEKEKEKIILEKTDILLITGIALGVASAAFGVFLLLRKNE